MLLQMALFCSFLRLSSIPLYICTTSSLSIHLSVNGRLGCFHVLAIVNSALASFLSSVASSVKWREECLFVAFHLKEI